MSLKDEFKKFIHPYDDEDEPVEYQEDDYQDRPRRDDRREERRDEERRSKVVNIHATTQLKVVLVKPSKYDEDATAIADHLLEKRTVVVNMENTDPDTARRLLDFVSGVAYATGGKVKRVAKLKARGYEHAGVYNPEGVGGTHVMYVLHHADQPELYHGLPKDPKIDTSVSLWKGALKPLAAAGFIATFAGLIFHYIGIGPNKEVDDEEEGNHE